MSFNNVTKTVQHTYQGFIMEGFYSLRIFGCIRRNLRVSLERGIDVTGSNW